jgi:5-methylcytosine-specific restriction endonuclease McrA
MNSGDVTNPDQRIDVSTVLEKICPRCETIKSAGEFYARKDGKTGLSSHCKSCIKAKAMATYAADTESAHAKSKAWYEANRDSEVLKRRDRRANMTPEQRATESAEKAAYAEANRDRIRARRAAYRAANRERLNAKNREWFEANREYSRSKAKAAYWADPETRRANHAVWYAANRDKVSANGLAYREVNKERIRAYHARYRVANPKTHADYIKRREANMAAVLNIPITMEQLQAKWDYWGGACWMCGDVATTTDHVKPLSKMGPHILANFRPACKPCNSRKHAKWFGPNDLARFMK